MLAPACIITRFVPLNYESRDPKVNIVSYVRQKNVVAHSVTMAAATEVMTDHNKTFVADIRAEPLNSTFEMTPALGQFRFVFDVSACDGVERCLEHFYANEFFWISAANVNCAYQLAVIWIYFLRSLASAVWTCSEAKLARRLRKSNLTTRLSSPFRKCLIRTKPEQMQILTSATYTQTWKFHDC